ncbi:MAG TPA: S41 family peptidase [Candidatus Anoxymicrobiaceae bacterium]
MFDRRRILLIAVTMALAALVTAVASCGSTQPTTYNPPAEGNFAKMTWTNAFEALHKKISREYVFTEWKSIDWSRLHSKYAPLIQAAQARNDATAYQSALRDYIFSIPDGHVTFSKDQQFQNKLVGGAYGLNVMKLDNGNIVAVWVMEGGPASSAGITPGARIISWGGNPINTALSKTRIFFDRSSHATTEGVLLAEMRHIVRAPVNKQTSVSFQNQGESQAKTVTLTAVDDGGESLRRNYPNSVIPPETNLDMTGSKEQSTVVKKMLPGNIGYVWVRAELDLPDQLPGNHTPTVQQFKNAIDEFSSQGVKGVVVDIRNNAGGSDSMVARMLGSLYPKKTFYEYQNYVGAVTGKMEIWVANETPDAKVPYIDPGQGLNIVPAAPLFKSPIVAIINNTCISSGEGIAMGVKNLPNGKTTGFYTTNGSFGMAGDMVNMPGGITISFPFGQSLDVQKVVQIDSRNMKGGVTPTVRTPLTLENALKTGAGQDVELEFAQSLIQ